MMQIKARVMLWGPMPGCMHVPGARQGNERGGMAPRPGSEWPPRRKPLCGGGAVLAAVPITSAWLKCRQ